MVKLIQIERLGPRIEGMLYKCKFEEQRLLLDEVKSWLIFLPQLNLAYPQGARKVSQASEALLHAKQFKEVLNVSFVLDNKSSC